MFHSIDDLCETLGETEVFVKGKLCITAEDSLVGEDVTDCHGQLLDAGNDSTQRSFSARALKPG